MNGVGSAQVTETDRLRCKLQLDGTSGTLVIVFSQVRILDGRFGLERLFASTRHNCLFVNDVRSGWYLGLDDALDTEIDAAIAQAQPERIIYYGASMGAYGALATGLRRQDGEVYAFAPELTLGFPDSQSSSYLTVMPKHRDALLSALKWDLKQPVTLLFGLYDWIDASQFLLAKQLGPLDNLSVVGVAGPHALHDQLYSTNIIRQLIKTFERDITRLISDKKFISSESIECLQAFVVLGHCVATSDHRHLGQLQLNAALLARHPGYGLLAADRLMLLDKPHKAAMLLQEWHSRINASELLRSTPKRWRKIFLVKAVEAHMAANAFDEAAETLQMCFDVFPMDEHMLTLAEQLDHPIQSLTPAH